MTEGFYFEDFAIGEKLTAGSIVLTKEHAIAFAREYDPQYFHTDEEAAKSGLWHGLVASGWNTAAVSMRLKISTKLGKVAGGLVGLGIESMKWPRPVYPGDELRIEIVIMEKRVSTSKPSHGVIRYRLETFNQKQEKVLELLTSVWVPLRHAVI